MLERIDELLNRGETFAFETTLATKSHIHRVRRAQKEGYQVVLLFFWLQTIELAKERVRTRVIEGGHNIPPDVIERRYIRGIKNLFDIYMDEVDGYMIIDNSYFQSYLIATKEDKLDKNPIILDLPRFKELESYYGE